MDATLLAGIAGMVLTLCFSYIPGLDVWYASLSGTHKRLIMGGLLLAIAGASFGLGCANLWTVVTCDKAGAVKMVEVFIAALVANQALFGLSPTTNRALSAKLDGQVKRSFEGKADGVG